MLSINQLINNAYADIIRVKGKHYAPNVHEIQAWIDAYVAVSSQILSKKTIRICTSN
jgi:hypothetical protein